MLPSETFFFTGIEFLFREMELDECILFSLSKKKQNKMDTFKNACQTKGQWPSFLDAFSTFGGWFGYSIQLLFQLSLLEVAFCHPLVVVQPRTLNSRSSTPQHQQKSMTPNTIQASDIYFYFFLLDIQSTTNDTKPAPSWVLLIDPNHCMVGFTFHSPCVVTCVRPELSFRIHPWSLWIKLWGTPPLCWPHTCALVLML